MAVDSIATITFGLNTTTSSEFPLRMVSYGLVGDLVGVMAAALVLQGPTSCVRMRRYRSGTLFSLLFSLGTYQAIGALEKQIF